jgi:alkanesulfonate monooxygenase SsuD/methylene tetrahydromethanopterin reductase-like flavin-dependent oxidoreductase (luciferase family)
MLDVMSNGRLVAGMVIGGGVEYFSYQVNPTHARERFREALDLIVKAWTHPGPFIWNSKHYFFRYVNPWPRPLQQPHPPIWIPGAGSLETIEFVAQRRYAYMGIPYFHIDTFKRVFGLFREACAKAGYEAKPEQMGWGIPIYVAETDRQAREEFEPHFWYFVRNLLKGIVLAPPGYTSARSALAIIKNRGSFLSEQKTWDDVEKGVFAIVGSPATVRQKLAHYQKELGNGVVLTGCQTGTLSHELARKSMELLAREVLPHVRHTEEAPLRGARLAVP